MHLARTGGREITITGNIKTTDDYLAIRQAVNEFKAGGGGALTVRIVDSFSMPSSVIGLFVKAINLDKLRVEMLIQDPRLLELLDELNLVELFQARVA